MSRAIATLLIGAVMSLAGPTIMADPAPAGKGDAQEHIDRATLAFKTNDLTTALAELRAAYAIEPRPELLYAIGQIYGNLHQCRDAIEYYQRFLATKPVQDQASVAIEAIDACNAADAKPVEPPKPPSKVETQPAAPTWYSDHLADVLVGGGALAIVVGLVAYNSATSDRSDADSATNYGAYVSLIDRAHSERAFAVVAGLIGAGLVGGGIAHYLLSDRGERGVQVTPAPGGAVVSVRMSW